MKNLTTLGGLIGLVLASTTIASIIEVPSEQPTIQAGINAASRYDTVLVTDGYYVGDGNRDIDFGGKDVYLMSVNGAEQTTIDCAATEYQPRRAFYLHSGESEFSVIEGFTISGAYGDGSYFDAAVRCENASPRLRYCLITENNCHGVMYANDTLRIDNCVVSYNTGHGITSNEGAIDIRDCEISYNGQCGFYWNAQWYGFRAEVMDCLVVGNGSVGVYLFIGSGQFHVQNCTMVGNETGFYHEWNFPKAESATAASVSVDTSTVENCIMAFNDVYGTLCYVWADPVMVRCSDAYGNGVEDFHYEGFGPDDDFDNFSADPMFCDMDAGDFTISTYSPCAPANSPCGLLVGAFGDSCTYTDLPGQADEPVPSTFSLGQNYPNPFNPTTEIVFELPAAARVKLEIFNMAGQKVTTFTDEPMSAGKHKISWDASGFASGVYLYRLKAGDFADSRKMLLLK
ncbi:MAG: right-handed parallel beta-helix repeat-containing protein [Candidatus Zixiibacteriota bacterium]